jgi:ribose 5-phosphate isomerase B
MRIAIGSDHRGFEIKNRIMSLLSDSGHTCEDFGCFSEESVDYPDIAAQVGEAVANGDCERGVLICGTGIGMSIAANKVNGIRAALCHNAFTAKRARQHNDANICCLSAEEDKARMPAIVESFLDTAFEGGRHQARVDKIRQIEEKYNACKG